jgi:hypothetical protein
MAEETQRQHLDVRDSMEVEDLGAVGGTLLDIESQKERQNRSHADEESVSEKARVYIAKNRNKTRIEDGQFGNVSSFDEKNCAVAPPRPPVSILPTLSPAAIDFETNCKNNLDFPSQFYTIRAARFRSLRVTTLRRVPGFSRLGVESGRPDCGFRVEGHEELHGHEFSQNRC